MARRFAALKKGQLSSAIASDDLHHLKSGKGVVRNVRIAEAYIGVDKSNPVGVDVSAIYINPIPNPTHNFKQCFFWFCRVVHNPN